MTSSTSHYRTVVSVRLLSRDDTSFTAFHQSLKNPVVIKAEDEFLGAWKSARIGDTVDISVTNATATACGLIGYLSGGPVGGIVNG